MVTMILPPFVPGGARRSDGGDVKASLHVRRSHNARLPSSIQLLLAFEWVEDDVLKYRPSLTFAVSVATLQRQVILTNSEDFCKLAIQAYGSDDFPFLRAASRTPPFFFMYKCLFEVFNMILPLSSFQCALLKHLNVALSQLHCNSWAMVKDFEVLCLLFNIRPSVSVFLYFFRLN